MKADFICQSCADTRGLKAPINAAWHAGTCDICCMDRSVISTMSLVHHTGADLPEDTGGADGI